MTLRILSDTVSRKDPITLMGLERETTPVTTGR